MKINPHLDFLLSDLFGFDSLHPDHLADLRKSGLTDDTIQLQRIRTVPPGMIQQLLGFDIAAIVSAMVIPFVDPEGGFMDHNRLKVFPPFYDRHGKRVKYLQPRGSGVRLFFPLATITEVTAGNSPLWIVEGEKKSLAVAQLGLPSVGFCGVDGWHLGGSNELLPDFRHLSLRNRIVKVVPDGDWRTNPNVARAVRGLLRALEARGAQGEVVVLPPVLRDEVIR